MPDFTPKHSISFPLPGDNIKDGNYAAKLTEDIKSTALTADAAIEAVSERVPIELWYGASPLEQTDLDALDTGGYTLWSGSITQALGIPESVHGELWVSRWGSTGGRATFRTRTDPVHVYETMRHTNNTWGEWVRTDAGAVEPPEGPVVASSGSGTKVIPLALTLGMSGGVTKPASGTVVIPTGWNAPILRWRLAVRDGNPRFGTAQSNPTTFTNIQANGQTVIPSAEMPNGTDIWYTNWVEGNPNESIGFEYAATIAPTALVGGGTINGANQTTMPFEMWVEAETPATTAVVAILGDSNGAGVGTTVPVHDSWVSQYCRRVGALPVHYAASGDAYNRWTDPDQHKWNRWQHLARPDVVIMALGSNDAGREGPASEIIEDAQVAWAIAAEKVSPNQHAITIKPRNEGTAGYNAARRGFNNWIKTQPEPLRAWHDMVSPVSSDDVTMDAGMYAPDGTHMTTAGHKALADSITMPIAVSGRNRVVEVSTGIYEIGAH